MVSGRPRPLRSEAMGRSSAKGRGVGGGGGVAAPAGEGPERPGTDAARDARARRIPEATVVRLPLYQRILSEMLHAGITTVSSEELAARAGVKAAKVRKDFSLFGSFGTRGTGYDAGFLAAQIERALGADHDWPVVIVGAGNLGRALANSDGFSSHGFRVTALFDVDPAIVGSRIGTIVVRDFDELGQFAAGPAGPPAIGVVATPAPAAQAVADALVAAGTASILNFAPRVLTVPPRVLVRYVELSVELRVLSFLLVRREATAREAETREAETRGATARGATARGATAAAGHV